MMQKANSILSDPSHSAHELFQLLPSGKRYRSIAAKSKRHANSFYPGAIRLLNSQ